MRVLGAAASGGGRAVRAGQWRSKKCAVSGASRLTDGLLSYEPRPRFKNPFLLVWPPGGSVPVSRTSQVYRSRVGSAQHHKGRRKDDSEKSGLALANRLQCVGRAKRLQCFSRRVSLGGSPSAVLSPTALAEGGVLRVVVLLGTVGSTGLTVYSKTRARAPGPLSLTVLLLAQVLYSLVHTRQSC